MPTPLDKNLYEKAKKEADAVYRKPSAYKSGFIVKKYKELGGRYGDDGKPKNLKRWFREEWQDVGGMAYPTYRPTRRVSAKTPLTVQEVKPSNLASQIKLKQQYKGRRNLPPFIGNKPTDNV